AGDYTHGMDIQTSAPYTSAVDPRRKYATWVEIDLAAIEGNARALVARTDARLMAVVKANGYGHGAVETARAAARGGAAWFGVARAEEALELRESGIEDPILILGPVPSAYLEQLVAHEISFTVCDEDQIAASGRVGKAQGVPAKAHLKIDTGMSRLGADPNQAVSLARKLRTGEAISFEGIFTHFARADEPDSPANREQLDRFEQVLSQLDAEDLRPPIVHAANSAATLKMRQAHFDMVRVGIALYGLQPSKTWSLPEEFQPALQWKSQLSRVRVLPSGTGVSYGHDYVTADEEQIGTFPVGYADGLRRVEGNRVLVSGQQVPVVGRVCMDLSMLQLDAIATARAGDEVVIIGNQAGSVISAEQVADRWGTINYEVTCGIGHRVPRLVG
ncbi:MAG: alanine racemase, partial [Anaerolineales bacterium]